MTTAPQFSMTTAPQFYMTAAPHFFMTKTLQTLVIIAPQVSITAASQLCLNSTPPFYMTTDSPIFMTTLFLISRPGRSQGLLYKHLCYSLIHSVTHSAFSSISFTAPPRPNG